MRPRLLRDGALQRYHYAQYTDTHLMKHFVYQLKRRQQGSYVAAITNHQPVACIIFTGDITIKKKGYVVVV